MSFEEKEAISLLSDHHLKLADQPTYLIGNISSTELDVNVRLEKAMGYYVYIIDDAEIWYIG